MPSKELKARFANGQIKVNNEVIKDMNFEIEVMPETCQDLGEFLFYDKAIASWFTPLRMIIFDIRDMFDANIKHPSLAKLNDYTLVSWSKKDEFVFKKIKNEE